MEPWCCPGARWIEGGRWSITSVDHALRLASLLQMEGTTTVSDAAAHLGIAPSTAHRLLAMLVYCDFATREGRF